MTTERTQWEYMFQWWEDPSSGELNAMGELGWEVCGFIYDTGRFLFYFKRPKVREEKRGKFKCAAHECHEDQFGDSVFCEDHCRP